jgi:hypothetical protein
MPSKQKQKDLSNWVEVDTFKVGQAICLWAGINPAIDHSARTISDNSRYAASHQLLTAAIEEGELLTNTSKNVFANQGEHLSSTVKRSDLRAFAESKNLHPTFLFNASTPKAEVSDSSVKSKAGRASLCPREIWLERLTILALNNKINLKDSQEAIAEALVDDIKKLGYTVAVTTVMKDWIGPIVRKAKG